MHDDVIVHEMPFSCDIAAVVGGVVGDTAQAVPFQVSASVKRAKDALEP
jgi:hypothetical protein